MPILKKRIIFGITCISFIITMYSFKIDTWYTKAPEIIIKEIESTNNRKKVKG